MNESNNAEIEGLRSQLIGLRREVEHQKARVAGRDQVIVGLEFELKSEKSKNLEHESDYLKVWKLIKQPNETVTQACERMIRRIAELENSGPVRLCCGQRHLSAMCPDGLVMCGLCFDRFPPEGLHLLPDGSREDVCLKCHQAEEETRGGQ